MFTDQVRENLIREIDRSEKALRIGDQIFLSSLGPGDLTKKSSWNLLSRIAKQPNHANPFFLACTNTKGVHMDLCTEKRLNFYSYIGIFEVLPKISVVKGVEPQIVTHDQMKYMSGREVKYGDRIVLRHLYSGGYLSPNLSKPSNMKGSWKLKLKVSESVSTEFVPSTLSKYLGEPVMVCDLVSIAFMVNNKKLFLTIDNSVQVHSQPAAHLVSSSWKIHLFRRGKIEHKKVCYGSPIHIRGYAINLKLSKREMKKDIENTSEVHLKSKSSSYDTWVLERCKDNAPYSMDGGVIKFNECLFIRNLATNEYLTKDLSLTLNPAPEDYFQLFNGNPESSNSLNFGMKTIIRNSEYTSICIKEDTYLQSSFSKAMCPIKKLRGSTQKSAPIQLDIQNESSSHLFEFISPPSSTAKLIRKLNLINPIFKEFSNFIMNYGSQEYKITILTSLMSPNTPKHSLANIIEEILAATRMLVSLLKNQKDLSKFNRIQKFMEKLNIHTTSLNLLETITRKIHCSDKSLFSLDTENENGLKIVNENLWSVLMIATERNSKVSFKMNKHMKTLVGLFEFYPDDVSRYTALVMKGSFPMLKKLESFANDLLFWLKEINHDTLLVDTNCLNIANECIMYNDKILRKHQEMIKSFLFQQMQFYPLKFSFKTSEINISIRVIRQMNVEELIERNKILEPYITKVSNRNFKLSLKDFTKDAEYTEYLIKYLKLYRFLFDGTSIDVLNEAYCKIGLNSNSIATAVRSDSFPLTIQKEFIFLAVSYIMPNAYSDVSNKLCLQIKTAKLQTAQETAEDGNNHLIKLLVDLWGIHVSRYIDKFSLDEVRYILSLLENSVNIAKNGLFKIDDLTKIANYAFQFISHYVAYNNGNFYQKQIVFIKRILHNFLTLIEIYTDEYFLHMGEFIVNSEMNPHKDTHTPNEFTEEVELISMSEPTIRDQIEFNLPAFKIGFSKDMSNSLIKILMIANKIDQSVHLRTLKLLEKCYTPYKYFFKSFTKIEMYCNDSVQEFLSEIIEIKKKLTDPILENSLSMGNHEEILSNLKSLRLIVSDLTNIIDPRQSDKYKVFHLQNLMRNYKIYDNVIQLWNVIKYGVSDIRLEEERLKTVSLLVAFTYAFIQNNKINQKEVKGKLNSKFYAQLGLLSTVTQQITSFKHLPISKIKSFIDILLKSFIFVSEHNSPSMLKWIIALIFKNISKPSYEIQSFIADKLLIRLNSELGNWDTLEDHESIGESIYTLSFCCIQNKNIKDQCKFYFKKKTLLKSLRSDCPFSLKRGLVNITFRLYFENCEEDFNSDLAIECASMIDYFEANLESIKILAKRAAYEMIPPVKNSYRVEINQCKDLHNDPLYLAWTFACFEYNYGKTGILYFLPLMLRERKSIVAAQQQLRNLQDSIEKLFKGDFYYQDLHVDISNCIERLEGYIIQEDTVNVFYFRTSIPEEQIRNRHILQIHEILNQRHPLKDDHFSKALTDRMIIENIHLQNLVYETVNDDDKNKIRQFFKYFLARSTTLYQISVFYGILKSLFVRCKKKLIISELLIQSDIISGCLKLLQNVNRPRLQIVALKFLSTISHQKSSIVQDLIMKKLLSHDIAFSLFKYFNETLKETAMSCLDCKPISETSFKFNLSKHFLKFLASLCDNCNLKLQKFMKCQTELPASSIKNVNLVKVVFEITADLTEKIEYLSDRPSIKKLVRYALETLIEFTTGPCHENQNFLLENVQTYLIINSLFTIDYDFEDKLDRELYTYTANFLEILTEEDPVLTDLVPKYLDIDLILKQITILHNVYTEQYKEKDTKRLHRKTTQITMKTESQINPKEILSNGVILVIFLIKFEISFPYHNKIQGVIQRDLHSLKSNLFKRLFKISTDYSGKFMKNEKPEISFFKNFIGSVEIERDSKIHKHYFQIPYRWRLITKYTANNFIESVDHTSRADKLETIIEAVLFIEREMSHQQKIRKHKCLNSVTKNWDLYGRINYFVLVLINFIFLVFATDPDRHSSSNIFYFDSVYLFIIDIGAAILVILSILSIIGFVFQYYPIMILKAEYFEKRRVNVRTLLENSTTVLRSRNIPRGEINIKLRNNIHRIPAKKKVYYVIKEPYVVYHFIFLAIALISVHYPIFYSILLLDIMKISNTLRDVFQALTKNLKQLIMAFFLGCIFIYIYSNIGFIYLDDSYGGPDGDQEFITFCGSLWECYISTFYTGIRFGGGIGDALIQPDLSHDEQNYYQRVLFDLTFFMIINIILMNVIFGIIIDTFAQLRDIRTEQKYFLERVCFICHQKRSFFELQKLSFVDHAAETHNLWAYLFFLCYVHKKKSKDCTGIEKYVKSCVKREDISFFPTNAKSLRDKGIDPDN